MGRAWPMLIITNASALLAIQGPTVNATQVSLCFFFLEKGKWHSSMLIWPPWAWNRGRRLACTMRCVLNRDSAIYYSHAFHSYFMHWNISKETFLSFFNGTSLKVGWRKILVLSFVSFQARLVIASHVKIMANAWKIRTAISIVLAIQPIPGDYAKQLRICKLVETIFAGITERVAFHLWLLICRSAHVYLGSAVTYARWISTSANQAHAGTVEPVSMGTILINASAAFRATPAITAKLISMNVNPPTHV